jgi:hypothetical protein
MSGATFHPLDDNLIITHGRGHLAFWHRRKDGFFEKTDIIKPVNTTSYWKKTLEQKLSFPYSHPAHMSQAFSLNQTVTLSPVTVMAT